MVSREEVVALAFHMDAMSLLAVSCWSGEISSPLRACSDVTMSTLQGARQSYWRDVSIPC